MLRILCLLILAAATLAAQPKRIVSTAPSITEILFALGFGDRVAGVTQYCHYPPEARTRKKIGSYIQPDLEAIAALKPDLVLIQKNPIDLAGKLARLSLKSVEVEYDSVPQVYSAIEAIALACGDARRGRELASGLRAELEAIRAKTAVLPPRKLVFVVGRSPGALEGIIVAGRATYLQGIIEIAGGENAFGDAIPPYPKISRESLFVRDPYVIADMGDMSATEGITEARKRAVVALWNQMAQLRAVREHRVYAIADDFFVVPGPRMVLAAREFAKMLHPEAFR